MRDSPGLKAIKAYIEREVRRLLSVGPARRYTLAQLLRSPCPVIELSDGSVIKVDDKELRELASLVPEPLWERITLPILLVRDLDLGPGAYEVYGSRYEKALIARILGVEYRRDERLVIYSPHVSEIIRRFKTLTVITIKVRGLSLEW